MEKIKDYDIYLCGMRKSLQDKEWFIGDIPGATAIVDYGCADGTLLDHISTSFPNEFTLFGIDNDPEMRLRAKDKLKDRARILGLTLSDFNGTYNPEVSCLNLSSVIHEVYSYCSKEDVDEFWKFVFKSKFKYISIRDMAMSRIDTSKSFEQFNPILNAIERSDPKFIKMFREYWNFWGMACMRDECLGRNEQTRIYKKAIEFLLKYRYSENWRREMYEDYLPLDIEEIILKVPTAKYRIVRFDHYCLPFNKRQIRKDFGIDFEIKTHYKLLLERV